MKITFLGTLGFLMILIGILCNGDMMAKKDDLKIYRARRNVKESGEPAGKKEKSHKKPMFVIQKHEASHLHYDFRLEMGGTLKSWAVPKGPSLNPKIKRLAVETEDHPLSYGDFEGNIPEGNYGAGAVMVWDTGTYDNIKADKPIPESMMQSYEKGRIEVVLHGKKLHGAYALIRMHDSKQWLLIKMQDEYADARRNPVSSQTESANTGRSMAEIRGDADEGTKKTRTKTKTKKTSSSPRSTSGSKKKNKKIVSQGNDSIKVGKYQVKITNPDRILFPKSKITKQELIDYYIDIAPTMLPYLKNRPISMQRFPEGITGEGFFQKDAADYFPEFVDTIHIGKEGGSVNYVMVNNAATLAYLANLACITIHPWLSTTKSLHKPDRIIFDLDPSGTDFNQIRKAALLFKELLEELGLVPFVMTTGSRGLHVTVPIKAEKDFDEVKKFAHEVGNILIDRYPEFLTGEIRKDKRSGKIFVDYLRNAFGQTGVAAYAVRPHENAPVATPLEWKEVKSATLKSQKFTIKNIFKRLATLGDPWQDMKKSARSITKAQKKLEKMKE